MKFLSLLLGQPHVEGDEYLVLDDKSWNLVDFCWSRRKGDVMQEINNAKFMQLVAYLTIMHLAEIHELNFFHGDIKPANVFIAGCKIDTDAGSLTFLDERTECGDDDVPMYKI